MNQVQIAVINDFHIGARNNNSYILNNQLDFLEYTFFPTLKKKNIKTVVIAGDLFDNRAIINLDTLSTFKKAFFDKLLDYEVILLVGNHDVYYKNTNDVNTPRLLLSQYSNIRISDRQVSHITINDTKICIVPWLYHGAKFQNDILGSDAEFCIGHFEINGFSMNEKSIACIDGLKTDIFAKFKMVYSGHYHSPSKKGNIQYLGAPCQFTFNDLHSKRGFNLISIPSGEVEFIENPNELFIDYIFNDIKDIPDWNIFNERYVKLYISGVTIKEAETFIKMVKKYSTPANLSIVYSDFIVSTEEVINNDASSIDNIISCVDSINSIESNDKKLVKKTLHRLQRKIK